MILKEAFYKDNGLLYREVTAGEFSGVSSMNIDASEEDDLSHKWWEGFLRELRPPRVGGQSFKVVDLFCGSGGLSLGVHEAARAVGLNAKVLVNADMDGDALEVYRRNFAPDESIHGNVASVVDFHVYGREDTAELAYAPELTTPKLSRLVGKVDLLVAGPPCQGHSNLNNHTRRDDPRNQLYVAVAACAIALKVRAVIIENVPEVRRASSGVVTTAKRILEQSGYVVSDGVLSALELGAGQTRRRHFLVATKKPHIAVSSAVKILKKKPMTLLEIIGDLAERDSRDFMDQVPILSEENQDRINFLFDNEMYDLPNQVRPDCHKNGHNYKSVYGRLSWDKPSQTITTGFLTPGRGRYIHPSCRRVLSPREAARIQGFPDWFEFLGTDASPSRSLLSKWIGDAVPSQMGYTATLIALSGL